ncbi:hypothetical protein [Desulfovibrio porci]|uniref:hypothetical protein n=1 Tax=Desulfovibrio porci TaxID=2605782 RepID=UPI002A82CE25|nr:hypothetical protein [Desulfovibrio porci]MDY3808628.1 hypothetical protein [Desulfovibrio porci]
MDTLSTTESGRAKLKPTRPQPISAAKEFCNLISKRKDTLEKELPPEHFALLAVLEHEHPKDMAHIIANKLEELYPDEPNIRLRVLMHLYPEFYKKQPISFDFLQRQLATLEYEFSENKPFWGFIDSLRYIFNVLPKPKRYDLDKRIKVEGEDATFSAHQIMMQEFQCIHCWRMVYRYPSLNGKILCESHDMPSTSKEYKKRQRMLTEANHSATVLFNGASLFLKQLTIETKTCCAHKLSVFMCMVFPHVREFLLKTFAENGAYTETAFEQAFIDYFALPEVDPFWRKSPKEHEKYMQANEAPGAALIRAIVDALDPPPRRPHTQLANARELYVQRLTWNFGEYLYHLCRAEAWLEVEKNTKHGGKREGSGRKTQKKGFVCHIVEKCNFLVRSFTSVH